MMCPFCDFKPSPKSSLALLEITRHAEEAHPEEMKNHFASKAQFRRAVMNGGKIKAGGAK